MRVRVSGLLQRDGRFLMLHYSYPNGDVYGFPGGGVDDDERLTEALVREFKEELGLVVTVGALRFVGDAMAQPNLPRTLHVVFDVESAGEPILNPAFTSANSFEWLAPHAESDLNLYPVIQWEQLLNQQPTYLPDCMRRAWL